jgi:hypothetical protein
MADVKISALTAAGSALSTDEVPVNQGGTTKKVTLAQVSAAIGSLGAGKVVQEVYFETGAYAAGSTIIPLDDTIPQNTEGDQYMTVSITPTSATNRLKIDVVFNSMGTAAAILTLCVFQDAIANAIATTFTYNSDATVGQQIVLTKRMLAGTTSAITFKVRAGYHVGGTVYFNGQAAARKYGGTLVSCISVQEIIP